MQHGALYGSTMTVQQSWECIFVFSLSVVVDFHEYNKWPLGRRDYLFRQAALVHLHIRNTPHIYLTPPPWPLLNAMQPPQSNTNTAGDEYRMSVRGNLFNRFNIYILLPRVYKLQLVDRNVQLALLCCCIFFYFHLQFRLHF